MMLPFDLARKALASYYASIATIPEWMKIQSVLVGCENTTGKFRDGKAQRVAFFVFAYASLRPVDRGRPATGFVLAVWEDGLKVPYLIRDGETPSDVIARARWS